MKLEQLATKTIFIQKICKGIKDFYENKPPYPVLNSSIISIRYMLNETGRRIKKIKS